MGIMWTTYIHGTLSRNGLINIRAHYTNHFAPSSSYLLSLVFSMLDTEVSILQTVHFSSSSFSFLLQLGSSNITGPRRPHFPNSRENESANHIPRNGRLCWMFKERVDSSPCKVSCCPFVFRQGDEGRNGRP